MNDAIKVANLVAYEAEGLAGIAEDEVNLAAKRSRHTWSMYLRGLATAQQAECAVRAVMDARHHATDAASWSDSATLVWLAALESDRLVREATDRATEGPK